MTKARRRLVRLALILDVAGVEAVFAGSTYRELEAGLATQVALLTPSRRKAVRRQALRAVAEAGGLAIAADHLVARPVQQGSVNTGAPIESSLSQTPRQVLRCSSCRMRFGLRKRSFPSIEAALRVSKKQNDPRLAVYACPAGVGYHLGHPPITRATTVPHPATTTHRQESQRNQTHEAQ